MKTTFAPLAAARAVSIPYAVGLALLGCLLLPGCGFLKPANNPVRYYMLNALPPVSAASVPANAPAVGVGQVKLPAYLFNSSLAVRRGTNEIDYLPLVLWAERLDSSSQRVLAADLAALLPTDKIRLSAWRTEDVNVEIYASLERFDVDAAGQATLIAWWRITAPGGERILKSGQARITRQGPAPGIDPSGAVSTLSDAFADLAGQLANAIKETTPASR